MSSLVDLIEPLKRSVAIPGGFDAAFPNTGDLDLLGTLLDAFAECQLYGMLLDYEATDEGEVTPDLPRGATAMVVIFAMCRILSTEVMNRKSHVRYEASGNVFEQDQGAATLTAALKDLQTKRQYLIDLKKHLPVGTTVVDGYFVKATETYWTGFLGGAGNTDPFGGLW